MTLGTKPLTSKPGEFYARCRLPRIVKWHLATAEQKAEAKALGIGRTYDGVDSRGKARWVLKFPIHAEPFITTDRAAYLEHLEEYHAGGTGLRVPWSGALRQPLRLAAEGRPLNKAAADQLAECPDCHTLTEGPCPCTEAVAS